MELTTGSVPLLGDSWVGPIFDALATWLKPLWLVAVGAVGVLAVLYVAYLLLRLAAPKVAAIARTTAKEGMTQPVFFVILALGAFAIVVFPFIPYNTFGEDVKMLKESGLTAIRVLAILLVLWTASVSIASEIEGRTALTLLSKPIGRRQLILGKFLGIIGPAAILFIVLGTLFLASVSYKVQYDARETCKPEPTWQQCRAEMVQVAPGLLLGFLETVILASIAVAISTRLPMIPNLVICSSIYVLGHLVPILAVSAVGKIEFVRLVANLLSAALPVLDNFNMEGSIATGRDVPLMYMLVSTVYAAVYSTAAMLLALLMFEDRDLA
jgi:ABC-type transport system involved in multi-copper enzyme maturation permease subunit